ncbi:MAG: hypothetical protein CM1200mP29_16340 [Verrucomicrobiota bacterium]|nr:MAG: hypothetical protein CM1200mP29_16340 [Verrucomicrobiota bacterium]
MPLAPGCRAILPKLTKRQEDLWNIVEEWRELPLQGVFCVWPARLRRRFVSSRTRASSALRRKSPSVIRNGKEYILPSQPLELNAKQGGRAQEVVGR